MHRQPGLRCSLCWPTASTQSPGWAVFNYTQFPCCHYLGAKNKYKTTHEIWHFSTVHVSVISVATHIHIPLTLRAYGPGKPMAMQDRLFKPRSLPHTWQLLHNCCSIQ